MKISRRRFLTILAASALLPTAAPAMQWQGQALGADCNITLSGPAHRAQAALAALPALLRQIEADFSLYDPGSALCRLNAAGSLPDASPAFHAVIALSDQIYRATDGAFDPTVQPLWQSHSTGQPIHVPIGWHHLTFDPLTLKPGMALTLNGIAQGFATDAVQALLASHGFSHALINIGEYAAIGGPFRIGINDPQFGQLAQKTLTNRAIASSAPRATLIAGHPHIQHPRGRPALWSSVTVEADNAAMADALSTALVFQGAEFIRALTIPGLHAVSVVTASGDYSTLR